MTGAVYETRMMAGRGSQLVHAVPAGAAVDRPAICGRRPKSGAWKSPTLQGRATCPKCRRRLLARGGS